VTRPAAEERLRRILAVVPWVVAEDGPLVSDVCRRFGYAREQDLHDDLNLLFVCGVPPYTPDALIEVDVADGRVWIRYADWFSRPLRLTPAEALSLVAASTALLSTPAPLTDGTAGEIDSPLARGLAKLAGALGVTEELVDVTLGPAPADELVRLQEAARDRLQVEIDYYGYARDSHTTRIIDPQLVYSAGGQWYVAAYCHLAAADRLFRVDRVRRVSVLDTTFDARPEARVGARAGARVGARTGAEIPPVFEPSPADPVVILDLEPAGAWAATQYPTESVTDLGGGRRRVALRVSGDAWLARLLLRLGPDGRVVSGDGSAGAAAAGRVLARYSAGAGSGESAQPVASESP